MITKEKYQNLMNEKIRLERENNRLFQTAQKLLRIIQDSNLEIDLTDFKGIRNQAGISLIPGDGELTKINYKPFRHDF